MFNLAAQPSVWGAPVFAQIWDKALGFIQVKVYSEAKWEPCVILIHLRSVWKEGAATFIL